MVGSGDPSGATASFRVSNLPVRDSINVYNGVSPNDGPTHSPATVSFDVRWAHPITPYRVTNKDVRFTIEGFETAASIDWSAERDGFTFVSDPGSSKTIFAAVVRERNGSFFEN